MLRPMIWEGKIILECRGAIYTSNMTSSRGRRRPDCALKASDWRAELRAVERNAPRVSKSRKRERERRKGRHTPDSYGRSIDKETDGRRCSEQWTGVGEVPWRRGSAR